MRMRPLPKLGLLASLYLSQGLPYGFFTQALPVLLREQGVSLTGIGLSQLLALPWALKFLWAPLLDRRAPGRLGRRRGALIPLQLAGAATLAAVAALGPREHLPLILAAVLLTNLLSATQDIATDGLAVELLSPDERGPGNGVQVAGYRVGMVLGGGLLLVTLEALGWSRTFLVLAGTVVLFTVPVLLFREPPPLAATGAASGGEGRPRLLDGLDRRGLWPWLLLLVLYKAGEHLGTAVLRPFLVDLGLSLGDIGWLLGVVGFTAGLLGALAGGVWVGRLGRRRALVAFGLLQAATVASLVLAGAGLSRPALYALCALEDFASGMATAALFTAMMDACRPSHAATDYTAQASVVVLATGAAGVLGGALADQVGYTAHFLLSAALCLAGTAYVLAVPRGTEGLALRPKSKPEPESPRRTG